MIYLENSASTCIAACCTNMNGNLEKMTFFSFQEKLSFFKYSCFHYFFLNNSVLITFTKVPLRMTPAHSLDRFFTPADVHS